MNKEYYFVKININNCVNYVKIIKHEEMWEYRDFVLSGMLQKVMYVFTFTCASHL